jgi:TM2 domain-containing membrane protein YozV
MLCPACGKDIPNDAVICVGCGRAVVSPALSPYGSGGYGYPPQEVADFASKKVAAGVCGILFGALGVHKFILGQTTPGLIMLLVTVLSCGTGAFIMHPIGLIEGIVYLTKSYQEFYRQYAIEKKGWF